VKGWVVFALLGFAGWVELVKQLLQEIYERISGNFEASSFIANVREETGKKV
jgi:hypothetical protein